MNITETIRFCIRSLLRGAYTRGSCLQEAIDKMPDEIKAYCEWAELTYEEIETVVAEEKISDLTIRDADSDCIFQREREPLSESEYGRLRDLALKSAKDFDALYHSVPDKNATSLQPRKTFYGSVPTTAEEMYQHTKSVNSYYFGEIGVEADCDGTIFECRKRGFDRLELRDDFLNGAVEVGSYGEEWSVAKVLRRFIWHDRIHAKAMRRMIGKIKYG